MKQWFIKIYGSHIELRERLLRLIQSLGLVACIVGLFISVVLTQSVALVLTLAGAALVLVFDLWQIMKYGRVELAIWLIEILVNFIVFPVAFLTSGVIFAPCSVYGLALWTNSRKTVAVRKQSTGGKSRITSSFADQSSRNKALIQRRIYAREKIKVKP